MLPIVNDRTGSRMESPSAALRLAGSSLIVVGAFLCGVALINENGEPPWQVLIAFMTVSFVGIALRIEAAIRERRPQ